MYKLWEGKKKYASLKQMNRSEKGCKDVEKQKKNENLDHMKCLQFFYTIHTVNITQCNLSELET